MYYPLLLLLNHQKTKATKGEICDTQLMSMLMLKGYCEIKFSLKTMAE